jgi:hypothetical protein
MISIGHSLKRARRKVLLTSSTFAVTAALTAAMLTGASPASAGLSPGTGWTRATLPDGFESTGSIAPVSCASGTQFCVAIARNSTSGISDVVTTDSGAHWTGYTDLPAGIGQFDNISCVSTSVCWLVGQGEGGGADISETTDGGVTWTDLTPAGWLDSYVSDAIDCLSATDCWVGGVNADPIAPDPLSGTPWLANTTDGGATWTIFNNLPEPATQTDPNGTYLIDAISCTSTVDCVAAGGLNDGVGLASVIATTDGGDTWTMSTDPTLQGVQDIFGLSCVPVDGGLPVCNVAGAALQALGPLEITSTDGGTTWGGMETDDVTGWFQSISCPDAQHCWAGGGGTKVSLAGTANGGATWSEEIAETTNEEGNVSCASVSFCVTTADNAVWYTTDDGGLSTAATSRPLDPAAAGQAGQRKPVTRSLPNVSGSNVWVQTGHSVTLTGQFRGHPVPKSATAVTKLPNGSHASTTVPLGLNNFYSLTIPKVLPGSTTVTFTAGTDQPFVVRVHSHASAAPVVSGLSAPAGPAAGGNTLTVTGKNFGRVTNVLFGATPGTHLTVDSSTKLTVRVPAGTGSGYLTVVTAGGGPSALTGHAVYNWLRNPGVTKVSPASGRPAGGTTVTIRGTHFSYVQAVLFGKKRGTHLKVISPTELKVVSPAGGKGTVNIRVTTAGGTTKLVKPDHFTY